MDVFDAINSRRSVRSYSDIPVDWGRIITCIEAGMVAPNAGNLQVWRFTVVRTQDKKKAIADACLQQYWMEKAPIHIVIFAKTDKEEVYYGTRGTRLYCIQDCAMAAMNIMLAAQALDLKTCFVSAFDEQAMSRVFNLPSHVRAQGVITLGFSDEQPDKPSKYRVETLIGMEKFGTAMNEGGGRIPDVNSAVSNYRYAEKFPKYVQDAVSDFSKVTKKKREETVAKIKDSLKKKQ